MRVRATMLLLSGLLLAAPAYAQGYPDGPQPGRQGGRMRLQGMMMHGSMMVPGPMMILQLREPLGLTQAQVTQIEAIRDRVQGEHQAHMQAAMRAMQEADGLLEASDPDVSRYEAKLKEAADSHVQAQLTMARAWVEAREVLTPEQRSDLQFATRVMRQMMRQRMQPMQMMMQEMHPGMM